MQYSLQAACYERIATRCSYIQYSMHAALMQACKPGRTSQVLTLILSFTFYRQVYKLWMLACLVLALVGILLAMLRASLLVVMLDHGFLLFLQSITVRRHGHVCSSCWHGRQGTLWDYGRGCSPDSSVFVSRTCSLEPFGTCAQMRMCALKRRHSSDSA